MVAVTNVAPATLARVEQLLEQEDLSAAELAGRIGVRVPEAAWARADVIARRGTPATRRAAAALDRLVSIRLAA